MKKFLLMLFLLSGLYLTVNAQIIQGFVRYSGKHFIQSNVIHDSTNVILKDTFGNIVASVPVNSSGFYQFLNVAPAYYTVEAVCSKKPGGYNSVDALLVLKHFIHQITLKGVRFLAADVNSTGFVNSADALLITDLFLQKIPNISLPLFLYTSWVSDKHKFTMSTGTINRDIFILCVGDVNGSFNPF